MSSLYIHFPYCLYKCHYCDFNSYATEPSAIPFEAYLNAIQHEIIRRKQIFETSGFGFFKPDTKIKTVFFGGGTPSLMPANHVGQILQQLQQEFKFDQDCEITLEANPGTLTQNSIRDFIAAGINRISIGVQSLNEAYLSKFGRIHSAAQAREVMGWLRQSPLKSWNADLMFGFPGETFEEWQATLQEMLTHKPPHLSCYAFMVEEEAPYGRWVKEGRAIAPDDDVQERLIGWTRQKVSDAGYSAYEISNFAQPGHECRHNGAYWHYQDYLGLGAGAVSLFSQQLRERTPKAYVTRTTNSKNPTRYLQDIQGPQDFFVREDIDKKMAEQEWFMMNLRLSTGLNEKNFASFFGEGFSPLQQQAIDDLRTKGWLDTNLALTPAGVLMANQVVLQFFR